MIENKERKAQEMIVKKATRHEQAQQKATSLKAFNEHWSSKNGKAIGGKLHEGPLHQIQYFHLDPHCGITPPYCKYNMAIIIKKCKLKQQGQDLARLLPNIITPPFQFYQPTF